MENLSNSVITLFVATTILAVWQFYRASKSKKVLLFILSWTVFISVLAIAGFYSNFDVTPPRMLFLLVPVLMVSLIVPFTSFAKPFIDALDLSKLTLLHVIRIPVEITLYYVSIAGLIPGIMTFDGNNLDIISGITAPVVYYLVFVSKKFGRRFLLGWNFMCIVLLFNILTIAILALPTPFQQLAFEQPNMGVASFPLIWLPGVIVPIVLFSHMATIRVLLSKESNVSVQNISLKNMEQTQI